LPTAVLGKPTLLAAEASSMDTNAATTARRLATARSRSGHNERWR
jgi:hypothetical protein